MPNNTKNICITTKKLNKKISKSSKKNEKKNKPKAIKSPLKSRFYFGSSYNNLSIKPEFIKPCIEFKEQYKNYLNNPTNSETDNYIIKMISAYSYIPIINIIHRNDNTTKFKNNCPICLQNINSTNLAFLNCGHNICFPCLIKYLNFNYPNCHCPICKNKNIENNITSSNNNYIKEYLSLPDIKTFYIISTIKKWLLKSQETNSIYILISNYEKWSYSISNYIKSITKEQNYKKIIFFNYNNFLSKNSNKRSHNCIIYNNKIIENELSIFSNDNKMCQNNKKNINLKNINFNINIYLVDPIIKHISTKKKILNSIQNNIKNLKNVKNVLNKPLYKISDIKQYIIKDTIDEKIFREEVIFL